jgi:putative ABC transport system substrate-binding protein
MLAQALGDLGYVQGKNLIIEYRWALGRADRYHSLVDELVRSKVEVIVTHSTATIKAAKETARTVPIVMSGGAGVLEAGLIASLARPGGNITGVLSSNVELSGKRLELLKEVIPGLSRVAVIGLSDHESTPLSLQDAESAARVLALQLQVLLVRGVTELKNAFTTASRGQAGALLLLSGPMASGMSSGARIAELALRVRLPAISPYVSFGRLGGLMAYGMDPDILHRHAAPYIDKILQGANPADLPVEQPTKFELVINLKTAKALGLAIPPSVLMRADEVIE